MIEVVCFINEVSIVIRFLIENNSQMSVCFVGITRIVWQV